MSRVFWSHRSRCAPCQLYWSTSVGYFCPCAPAGDLRLRCETHPNWRGLFGTHLFFPRDRPGQRGSTMPLAYSPLCRPSSVEQFSQSYLFLPEYFTHPHFKVRPPPCLYLQGGPLHLSCLQRTPRPQALRLQLLEGEKRMPEAGWPVALEDLMVEI